MSGDPGDPPAPRWRFLIQPRWLGWHALMVACVLGMLALGDWQLRRAEAGNALSWAYTFEWPIFAGFAVVFWAKTIRDEFHPPARAEVTPDTVQVPGGRPAAAGGRPRPRALTTTRTTRSWTPTTPTSPG